MAATNVLAGTVIYAGPGNIAATPQRSDHKQRQRTTRLRTKSPTGLSLVIFDSLF